MSKGQVTKTKILHQAAELFNQKGYAGSSMADVMKVTGLKKGGIYNHFASKDELALAAFDYAMTVTKNRQREVLKGKRTARDRIISLIRLGSVREDGSSLIPGGCPLLNTAIEADDSNPALKAKAQKALEDWHALFVKILTIGIRKGEIVTEADVDAIATMIIATIEGSMMMSNLSGHPHYREVAIASLEKILEPYFCQGGGHT